MGKNKTNSNKRIRSIRSARIQGGMVNEAERGVKGRMDKYKDNFMSPRSLDG